MPDIPSFPKLKMLIGSWLDLLDHQIKILGKFLQVVNDLYGYFPVPGHREICCDRINSLTLIRGRAMHTHARHIRVVCADLNISSSNWNTLCIQNRKVE